MSHAKTAFLALFFIGAILGSRLSVHGEVRVLIYYGSSQDSFEAVMFESSARHVADAIKVGWGANVIVETYSAWQICKRGLNRTLTEFVAGTGDADLVILYYVGHGAANYLVPGGPCPEDPLLSDIMENLSIHTGEFLVVLDNCLTESQDSVALTLGASFPSDVWVMQAISSSAEGVNISLLDARSGTPYSDAIAGGISRGLTDIRSLDASLRLCAFDIFRGLRCRKVSYTIKMLVLGVIAQRKLYAPEDGELDVATFLNVDGSVPLF